MTGDRLLSLYPRAWRERYGAEFLATLEDAPLHTQQVINIISGAIDAWLSSDVRRATMAYRVAPGRGGSMLLKSMLVCESKRMNYTPRDAVIGSLVMLGATFLLAFGGVAVRRYGWSATGEILKSLAFPASLTLSMPFWLMKGQPWRAQLIIVGATLAILVGLSYLATRI